MAAPLSRATALSVLLAFQVVLVVSQSNFFLTCNEPQCKSIDLNAVEPLEISVTALASDSPELCIFCYPGQVRKWHRLWMNPKITIKGSSEDTVWDIFYGSNVSDVVEKSKSQSFLTWPQLSVLSEQHAFQPFNTSCIGISSTHSYTVNFVVKNPEIWFVGYLALGILIFLFAPSWSRNTILHYSAGVSFGVAGSVLLLLFVLNKFLPQKLKTLSYAVFAVSASASMFLLHTFHFHLHYILVNYWQVLVGYVVVAALVSFAVVYRYGPISNPRSLDLVMWLLQGLGLILVYQGSQIPEMAVAIIAGTLGVVYFPWSAFGWLERLRYRYFPPKRRLLTEEEFDREGQVETG
ncbi:nuclear envelope integral membrane protein 1, partial [Aplysia californica]|uniref:Nuclear envelope integral membrane protein 1 n=1 Tax=Aplysia californica TaxID=6500 RepID=A0ABM1ACE2_APLCA